MIGTDASVAASIRKFLTDELIKGKEAGEITDETDLVKTGIVDSINVLRLVGFLEEEYDIELEPSDVQQLTSIRNMTGVVAARRAA